MCWERCARGTWGSSKFRGHSSIVNNPKTNHYITFPSELHILHRHRTFSPLSSLQFSIYHHFGANQVLHFGSNPPFTTMYSKSSFLANEASPIQDRSQLSTVGLIGDIKELHAKPGPESTGSWTGAGKSSPVQSSLVV